MMKTRANLPLISLLPAVALFAGACADPGDLDPAQEKEGKGKGNGQGVSAQIDVRPAEGASRAHLMPMPGAARRPVAKGKDEVDSIWGHGGYDFTYRGGPVISHVKVVTVYWGANVPNQSSLDRFYQSIVQSPHIDWLSEYDTPTQKIGRGSFLASYVDTGAPKTKSLRDQDIQKEIARLIDEGEVPAPDADTLYMLHFPAGVSIDMQGNLSCQQYCAYHGTFTHQGKNVYYGVMPDFSGGCASCGGTSDKLQNTTIVSSHELVEAITDPAIGLANEHNDVSYLAWYDDQYGEIGDVCQSEAGLVGGWAVQAEYSMQAGACIVTKPGTRPGGGEPAPGGGPTPDCSHGVCTTGGPIDASCGPCVTRVCAADPSCCSDAWTTSCVKKAVSLCGKKCK